MRIERIEYFDGPQKLVGQLFNYESEKQQQPAIILFHAFEGLGKFTRNYAKSMAEVGYLVFAADMYGNGETADTIDGCFKLITPFLQDRELVRRRAVLAFDTLMQMPSVNKQKIGAMGFCFGGMCMLELARSGAPLHAGVSAHGVLAKSTLPTLPIQSKLLMLHGYQDPQVPPTEMTQFANEMQSVDVNDWTFVFFGDAKHSFTDPDTGTYDPAKEAEMGREYNAAVASRTFRYSMDFFNEHLAG